MSPGSLPSQGSFPESINTAPAKAIMHPSMRRDLPRSDIFRLRQITLFFTVYAAAVLLAVQPHFLGFPDPFLPSRPEIFIIKSDAVPLCGSLGCLNDEIVILVAAVEQRRRKGIESQFGGFCCCCIQSGEVAVGAALRGMSCYSREKFLKSVFIVVDHLQGFLPGKIPNGIETSAVLLVWVDVVVKEEAGYGVSLFKQLLERV